VGGNAPQVVNNYCMLARFSNLLARSFIVFLMAYLWLTFYIRNIIYVFFVSLAIMFVFNFVIWLLTHKKRNRIKRARHILKLVRKKITFKEYMKQINEIIFNPRRIKGYVFSGIIIFLTSFIVRFNIYYIVIATLLFSLALVTTLKRI